MAKKRLLILLFSVLIFVLLILIWFSQIRYSGLNIFNIDSNKWVGMNEISVRKKLGNPDREWGQYVSIGLKENSEGADKTAFYKTWFGNLYIYYKGSDVVESLYFHSDIKF